MPTQDVSYELHWPPVPPGQLLYVAVQVFPGVLGHVVVPLGGAQSQVPPNALPNVPLNGVQLAHTTRRHAARETTFARITARFKLFGYPKSAEPSPRTSSALDPIPQLIDYRPPRRESRTCAPPHQAARTPGGCKAPHSEGCPAALAVFDSLASCPTSPQAGHGARRAAPRYPLPSLLQHEGVVVSGVRVGAVHHCRVPVPGELGNHGWASSFTRRASSCFTSRSCWSSSPISPWCGWCSGSAERGPLDPDGRLCCNVVAREAARP